MCVCERVSERRKLSSFNLHTKMFFFSIFKRVAIVTNSTSICNYLTESMLA